jgi:TPR repeat protein
MKPPGMPYRGTARRAGCPARRRRIAGLALALSLGAGCGRTEDPWALFDAGRYDRSFAGASARAERDDPAAANLVGLHYYLGLGVARDFAAAGRWFDRAARLGDPAAQRNLATLYLRGLGLRQSDFLAFAWFSESARRGNGRAEHYLATMRDALTPSEIVRARRALVKELGQRSGQ